MDGKTALGASSPAKPALQSPEPLSHTRAVLSSSSHIAAAPWRGSAETGRVHPLLCSPSLPATGRILGPSVLFWLEALPKSQLTHFSSPFYLEMLSLDCETFDGLKLCLPG